MILNTHVVEPKKDYKGDCGYGLLNDNGRTACCAKEVITTLESYSRALVACSLWRDHELKLLLVQVRGFDKLIMSVPIGPT